MIFFGCKQNAHVWIGGDINYLSWGNQTIQMYGNFGVNLLIIMHCLGC